MYTSSNQQQDLKLGVRPVSLRWTFLFIFIIIEMVVYSTPRFLNVSTAEDLLFLLPFKMLAFMFMSLLTRLRFLTHTNFSFACALRVPTQAGVVDSCLLCFTFTDLTPTARNCNSTNGHLRPGPKVSQSA